MIIRSFAKPGVKTVLCVGTPPASKTKRKSSDDDKVCLYIERPSGYRILSYFVSKDRAMDFIGWMESNGD